MPLVEEDIAFWRMRFGFDVDELEPREQEAFERIDRIHAHSIYIGQIDR